MYSIRFQSSIKTKMSPKIERLKTIIEGEIPGGSYWDYYGNSLLIEEMDKFTFEDWDYLKADLRNWKSEDLTIIADAVTETESDLIDVNMLYGNIITIADDEEVYYLIQNLQILNDKKRKPVELLNHIRDRINNLKFSKFPLIESDYIRYNNLINEIIETSNKSTDT